MLSFVCLSLSFLSQVTCGFSCFLPHALKLGNARRQAACLIKCAEVACDSGVKCYTSLGLEGLFEHRFFILQGVVILLCYAFINSGECHDVPFQFSINDV